MLNDFKTACSNGDIEKVKFLVESGADIRSDGYEALAWAANCGQLEVVKFLVKNGSDVSLHHDLALRRAAENGHFEVVKFLCEETESTRALPDGWLDWMASRKIHFCVVEYLKCLDF